MLGIWQQRILLLETTSRVTFFVLKILSWEYRQTEKEKETFHLHIFINGVDTCMLQCCVFEKNIDVQTNGSTIPFSTYVRSYPHDVNNFLRNFIQSFKHSNYYGAALEVILLHISLSNSFLSSHLLCFNMGQTHCCEYERKDQRNACLNIIKLFLQSSY